MYFFSFFCQVVCYDKGIKDQKRHSGCWSGYSFTSQSQSRVANPNGTASTVSPWFYRAFSELALYESKLEYGFSRPSTPPMPPPHKDNSDATTCSLG